MIFLSDSILYCIYVLSPFYNGQITYLHPLTSFVFSQKGYNLHSFTGQMTLQ